MQHCVEYSTATTVVAVVTVVDVAVVGFQLRGFFQLRGLVVRRGSK